MAEHIWQAKFTREKEVLNKQFLQTTLKIWDQWRTKLTTNCPPIQNNSKHAKGLPTKPP